MSQKQKWRLVPVLIISLFVSVIAKAKDGYSFAIVPQLSAGKIAALWGPILIYLQSRTGYHFTLVVESSVSHFQNGLSEGKYDFAYMNPYCYIVYHQEDLQNLYSKEWWRTQDQAWGVVRSLHLTALQQSWVR